MILMKKSYNIVTNITIAIACFALFIVLFQSRIAVPAAIQVIGRLHPLVVHFPVTLFLMLFFYELIFKKHLANKESADFLSNWLLLLTTLSCIISVIAGILLSKENGYDEDAINSHKWFGVVFSAFMLLWFVLRNNINIKKIFNTVFCIAGLALNVIAGHLGAGITHGSDFVYAPLVKDKPKEIISIDEAIVFQNMVRPILENKCMKCHNSKKEKGELVMETEAALLKGGRNGSLWNVNESDLGLMLRRIHLPEDQKKHMPPAGKPQLTEEEIAILTYWIKKGSNFKLKVNSLPVTDSLYLIAQKMFPSSKTEVYNFAAADEKKIRELNTENRVVQPVAIGSPALDVSFFGASLFKPEQLNDLLAVKQQIVSLNLAKMPLQGDALKTILQFQNLRKLNLSFTPVKAAELSSLNKLAKLTSLTVSGIKLTGADLQNICALPAIKELFIWNSGIDSNELASIHSKFNKVKIDQGFNGASIVMQLNAPIILNEERVITDTMNIRIKHYIHGTTLRYTLDGKDPDSLQSPVYNGNLLLNKNTTFKVKAFKPGWIASDVVETYFFKNNHIADTAYALTKPDDAYKGNGAKTLVDGIKGDKNFRSGKWLGFKENKLETVIGYKEAFTISSVTLSTLVDIGGYIMPAQSVQVYGGVNKNALHLLGQATPSQPGKPMPSFLKGIEITCKPEKVRFLKIIATPVGKLPEWHPGKGQKGWLFADEIFVD